MDIKKKKKQAQFYRGFRLIAEEIVGEQVTVSAPDNLNSRHVIVLTVCQCPTVNHSTAQSHFSITTVTMRWVVSTTFFLCTATVRGVVDFDASWSGNSDDESDHLTGPSPYTLNKVFTARLNTFLHPTSHTFNSKGENSDSRLKSPPEGQKKRRQTKTKYLNCMFV